MELSPGQRRAAFAAIVLALAALGAFLLIPSAPRAAGARSGSASPSASSPAAPAATPAAPTPSPVVSASPSTVGSSSVDIYRLLPFSQADLGQAVGAVQRFADYYGTWSYRQNSANYVAPMRALAAPQLVAVIQRGFTTPGVADVRNRQKQIATGSAAVVALRAFGPSSLTFVVKIVQSITAAQGRSSLATQYAITVSRSGAGWQVTDIQFASAGNS